MIFSILLTCAFFFMALYTLAFMGGRLLSKLLLVLYAGAVFVLWQPDTSTTIANIIGIGRGVDFGLMLVSVISLNLIVFLIHHVHLLHKQITLLTRSMAIRDALESLRRPTAGAPDTPAHGALPGPRTTRETSPGGYSEPPHLPLNLAAVSLGLRRAHHGTTDVS